LQGQGKHSGPSFIQLHHHVKRSTSYHGLSMIARALLIELIDRYTGCNNGMIILSVREAAYELRCNKSTISRAFSELDDAGLVRPMKVGAWRGRHASEWKLTWKRCDKTGDLPRNVWQERPRYHQLLLPKPAKKPLSNAERQKRFRNRHRNENRNDKLRQGYTEVAPGVHGRYASCVTGTQNENSSITLRNPSCTTGTHLDIYQTQERDAEGGRNGDEPNETSDGS
jgi:hypothetical protein